MALDAGVMHITVEYAKDLKDCDWFGKQVRAGLYTVRIALGCSRVTCQISIQTVSM